MNAPSFKQLLWLYHQNVETNSFTTRKHWFYDEKGHVHTAVKNIPFKLSYYTGKRDNFNVDVTFILETRSIKIVYKAEQTIFTIVGKNHDGYHDPEIYSTSVGKTAYNLRLHHHNVRLKKSDGEDELMRLILSWPEA